jgi:hypothetical protein
MARQSEMQARKRYTGGIPRDFRSLLSTCTESQLPLTATQSTHLWVCRAEVPYNGFR